MKLFNIIFVTIFCSSVFATSITNIKNSKNLDYKNLITQIRSNITKNKLKAKTAANLLKFSVSPNQPMVQQEVTIFIQPLTGFTDSDMFIESTFDNTDVTNVTEHPTKDLWIYNAGALSEVKSHVLSAKIFIQDKNAAALLTEAITNITSQIVNLDAQIAIETDPVVLAQLTASRVDKVSQKNDLIQTLANLKTLVATENYNIDILADTAQVDYPKIFSVNPAALKPNTLTPIEITGQNFGTNPTVKISGQILSLVSHTLTSIALNTQSLPVGLHDLEIITTENNQTKNVILKNAFFVSNQITTNPNALPTAVVTSAQNQIALNTTASVSALNSFDSNNHPLRYEWRFLNVPAGSNQNVSTNPVGQNQNFSFNPNVPGFYVLELKVIQNEFPFLTSNPSYVAIEALSPANRAPTATATPAALSALINQTATSQINFTDADFWQGHAFYIKKQSAFGTATINQNGLITFTAGANAGVDTIEILTVDNGTPALSVVTVISVNVVATNLSPIISSVFVQNRSQGLPIRSLIAVQGVSDPDGTVTEIKVVMGDGTTEYAPVTGPNFGAIIHNYFAYGIYNATAYIKDNLGAVTTYPFTANVTNTDNPIPKFFVNQFSCASAPCTISADATLSTDSNGITQYRWLWGDGSAEEFGGISYMSRSHTFNSAGTYKIRLRLRDQYLSQADGFATVYVGVTAPSTGSPSSIAYIPTSNREILVNTPYTLDASRSFDPNPNGGLSNYTWNFNCVNSSCLDSGITANITYSEPTNYNPILTVTNALGGTIFGYGSAEITAVNAGHAPKSIMTVNNQVILFTDVIGTAPFTANLDSSKSFDYDGSIILRNWDFGDGTFNDTNAIAVQKIYSTAGVYFVMLAVKDNDGNYMRLWQKIIVNPASKKISLMTKQKSPKDFDEPSNDQEQALSNSCGEKNAMACFELSKIYQARGDTFVSGQLKQRSCQLGYAPACGSMKVWK